MDMIHVRRKKEKEDRLSKLQDDIIHRILGFLDMKYAIQTSMLSRKWRYIWTSMPHLNFDSYTSGNLRLFAKFVKRALSHRKNGSDVSSVKLAFKGDPTPLSVKSIVNYAYSHNVQQLMIVWTTWKCPELPLHFFICHTLKHLTIRSDEAEANFVFDFHVYVPKTAWYFPALETLNLSGLRFAKGEDLDKDKGLDIFSKCVNLKNLTLHCCNMSDVLNFNVCAPQLLNLALTGKNYYPKVFNVVAPQLENFTASVKGHLDFLRLSAEGLNFLEKANLSSSYAIESNKSYVPLLLDLFQKLHSAKFLILGGWIMQALSLYLDQVSHEPCPFNNLKCLKIDMAPLLSYTDRIDHIAKKAPQIRKYLLENSPDAIFIMDLPQIPPMKVKRPMQVKRPMSNKMPKLDFPTAPKPSSSDVSHQISRQYVRNDAKKMANLEAKIQVQDQLIVEQKAMFEAKLQVQDKVIADQIEKVQMQDEVIAKQKATFEARIQMQNEVIANQKALFEAKIQIQDVVFANQKATFEAKIQVQDQLIVEQKAMFEAKIHMRDKVVAYQIKKVQMQDEVIANHKAAFEAKIQMQDKVIAKQKATFEAKMQMQMQMQNEVTANQKATFEAKIQMQDEVIAKHKTMFEAMVEAEKLQHEKLMSLIIKSKIAELRVKIQSEKPDDEVIRSMGIDIKSLMDLIPESIKIKLEARFSAMYEGFKSLFLTHFDDSQWERIKSELEKEYKGFLA